MDTLEALATESLKESNWDSIQGLNRLDLTVYVYTVCVAHVICLVATRFIKSEGHQNDCGYNPNEKH